MTLDETGQSRAVLVYYGDRLPGAPLQPELVARALAGRCGCLVAEAGDRLASEHRYPAAVEEAWSALLRAAEQAAGARLPLIVAGEGTGGNLAAVVARRARDAGGPAVALQVLICPVTDADFDSLSYADPANQPGLDQPGLGRDAMISFWDGYLPDARARSHPDAAPLQEVFLSGLPPAVIVTAERDVLRDDGELYATRLVQAGVRVEHRRFPGQRHGFFGQSDEALAFAADAISGTLNRRPH